MGRPEIFSGLKEFAVPDIKKSITQLVNTILPYFFLFAIMCCLLKNNYPYWTVILSAIINAGFMVRTFIIFHDCTHGSFFKSRTLCKIVGHLCGIITFTPFYDWQLSHKIHYATSSNLDKRGAGDVWIMTVNEYNSSSAILITGFRNISLKLYNEESGELVTFRELKEINAKV
jgi:acyl-lipid omega-6 desaturase (Delta-12 desaturase)